MLRALLAALMVAPAPVTTLDLSAPDPPGPVAGQSVEHEATVQLAGPPGAMPGLAGPVNVTLDAPAAAGCTAPDEVRLDPVTGRAPIPLACRPAATGAHRVSLTARSPPHRPGSWNATLNVAPDALTGALAAGEPDGYDVPVELALAPEHLDAARVDITLTGHRLDAPLGFVADERTVRVGEGWSLTREVPALHGPGGYELVARAEGPNVEPTEFREDVTVPAPADQGAVDLNVTVEQGEPNVTLTSDSVNDDGVNKRPGDTLYTRLTAEHADRVNVTVRRPTGDGDVALARDTLDVPSDGRLEHTFTHPVLPSGLLRVQATAGDSSVARTAQIRDLEADARASLPETVLGDGRPVEGTLRIEDPNHGSTDEDPARVWGLPEVTWTVYRGSLVAEGWQVQVGPFEDGPEGTAETSTVPWPDGTAWARVGDGWAALNATLTPPAGADAGTYRWSVYAPDGDRIGGDTVDLEAPPTVDLQAGPPTPGRAWPVNVTVEDPVPGTTVNVTVLAEGQPVASQTAHGSGTVRAELPQPLPEGATVEARAMADWPGRPARQAPDATVTRAVPAREPRVSVHPSLDGAATPAPVAAHPDHAHTLAVHPSAVDPNGAPVETSATLLAPDGTPTGWVEDTDEGPVAELPAGAEAGRYELVVRAESRDGTGQARVPVDVAEIARLRVADAEPLTLAEGEAATREVTLRNAGSVALDEVLLRAEAPDALDVAAAWNGTQLAFGEPAGLPLSPGDTAAVNVTVAADAGAAGDHTVRLTVAGVHP